jgi:hypothetical protein
MPQTFTGCFDVVSQITKIVHGAEIVVQMGGSGKNPSKNDS